MHKNATEKLVAEVNTQRKDVDGQLAQKNQISLKQVDLLVGQKAYNKPYLVSTCSKMEKELKNCHEDGV